MKQGTSIALENEIKAGLEKQLYRKQCIDALTKCKDKENKLKTSEKVIIKTVAIPYGFMTVYKKIR